MCNSRFEPRALGLFAALLLAGLAGGCTEEPGDYRFGFNVTGIEFTFFDEDEGIFPSDVTLTNPNNPFRFTGVAPDTKFELLAQGGNAGGFYAMATVLASIPTGEHQFFTAVKLHDMAVSGELADDPEVECRVTRMAARAYQTVLDEFPDAVSFLQDATPFYLAPLAYGGIQDLGLPVQGDWVLATDDDGNEVVVRIGGRDAPRPDFTPEDAEDPCDGL
jgi:hypothetical protein